MTSWSDRGWLLLRVLLGCPMVMLHGWSKAQLLFAAGPVEFADPLGLGATPTLVMAVASEFVAPLLVLLGVATRWAATLTAATMGVAFFVIHGGALIGDDSGELAFVYLVGFAAIALGGGGSLVLRRPR